MNNNTENESNQPRDDDELHDAPLRGKLIVNVPHTPQVPTTTMSEFEQLGIRLTRFITVSVVVGILLCITLGYEAIRTELAVVDVQDTITTINVERHERSAQVNAWHNQTCTYVTGFVSTIAVWSHDLQAADTAELKAGHNVSYFKKRAGIWENFDNNLNALGTNACTTGKK